MRGAGRPPHAATLQMRERPGAQPPHPAKMGQLPGAKAPPPHAATLQPRASAPSRPAWGTSPAAPRAVQRAMAAALDHYAIVSGEDIGARPGLYPKTIDRRTYKKYGFTPPTDKDALILWFKRNDDAYPTEQAARAGGITPNGGVQRNCNASLGTFAVYRCTGEANAREAKLSYWVDFDHTPIAVDEDANQWRPRADLADGHYHPGARIGDQIPITPQQLALGAELLDHLDNNA